MVAGREVFTSASIGICFGTARARQLPTRSCATPTPPCITRKSHGKARHELFDADMHARTRDRLDLENDLRHAVSNQDFEVHYQPIVLLGDGHVRRFRVADSMDAQWQARLAGDVRAHGRRAGPDRTARHVGASAGVPDVCGVAAAVPGRRSRLHHRQRVEPAADAAELPQNRRAGRREVGAEAVRPAARNHRNRVDGQPELRRRDASPAARIRREDVSRRLRHRLFVAQPPAQASGRCAQDRSLVREEPRARRIAPPSSRASSRWPGR